MKKFLIGCGVAVLILGALGLGTSIYLFKKVGQELAVGQQAETLRKQLRDEYGAPASFAPATIFEADRFARFLEIRERLHAHVGPQLESTDAQIERAGSQKEGGGVFDKLRGVTSLMRGGVTALRIGLSASALRDSLLLQEEMPEGEFLYYHCLSVHTWLGWAPPEQAAQGGLLDEEDWEEAVEESSEELRDVYVEILGNQAAAMAEREDLAAEESAYLAALREQLSQSWKRTANWPMQGMLPEAVTAQLVPSEARLEATLPTTRLGFLVDLIATLADFDDEQGVKVRFGS